MLPAQWVFTLAVLLLVVAFKVLAVREFAPLYRAFLALPAAFAGLFTGYDYIQKEGTYLFPGFILDYSCAGINFFLICCIAAATIYWRKMHSVRLVGRTLVLVFGAAWLATTLANVFRIGISLRLSSLTGTHAWLHEAVGTLVFLVFLFSYHYLLTRLSDAKTNAHI